MGLFRRRTPIASGTFRVTGVTRLTGVGTTVINGVPQQHLHVAGLLELDGQPPEAAAVEVRLGTDRTPQSGAVLPAQVLRRDPLRLRVEWDGSPADQQVQVAQQDATAQVVADLATGKRPEHVAGEIDPLGIAVTAPDAYRTIAEQVAATLGTPISLDASIGGAEQHLTANRSGHLTTAEAAELLRTGTAATATIRGATRVPIPQALLPGADASLWDLDLQVTRANGTDYRATTRVGFRTEARRGVLGLPGTTIPVRMDPHDDTRVAVDGVTFDAQNPGAPAG